MKNISEEQKSLDQATKTLDTLLDLIDVEKLPTAEEQLKDI